MEVAVLNKEGKEERIFRITLTCVHCNEPLYKEKAKEDDPVDAGIIHNCSICQAKISCNVELYENVEEEERHDVQGEATRDNQS